MSKLRERSRRLTSDGTARAWLIALWTTLCALACAPAPPPADRAAARDVPRASAARPTPAASGISEPIALNALVGAAAAAFRPVAGAFEGGGSTYAVRANAGAFTVAPIHHAPERERHPRRAAASRRTAAPAALAPLRGGEVRFETTQIARGARSLGAAPRGRVAQDGHLVIARGDVEEHLRNLAAGVELSYAFARAPDGEGDLVVSVEVSGQAPLGETEAGLHFADRSTGLGVRVGRATWIDARGRATDVPLRATAAGIELRVPDALLDASAYPALLDPVISPELSMDVPVSGPATGGQTDPAIAFDGTTYLTAWTDYRGTQYHQAFGEWPRVYAARITADGTVLDPVGIDLGKGSTPHVAAGGGIFAVAYETSSLPPVMVQVALVNAAGSLAGRVTLSAAGEARRPQVAFDGAHFTAVWADEASNPWTIQFGRFTPAGVALDPGGVLLRSDATNPHIAFDGTNYLITHTDDTRRPAGIRLTPEGVSLDPAGFRISADRGVDPAVAFDGTNHVVAWDRDGAVVAARVTPAGAVLDPAGILVHSESRSDVYLQGVQVVSDRASSLVLFESRHSTEDTFTLELARLSPSGDVLGSSPLSISTSAFTWGSPAAAAAGSGSFMVVWPITTISQDSDVDLPATIVGSRLSAQGVPLDKPPFTVSTSANGQVAPSIAFDGSNFLVAWSEDRRAAGGGFWDVRATRVALSGAVLDVGGIAVETRSGWQTRPRAVFDGANTLVSWWDYDRPDGDVGGVWWSARAARVSPGGSVLDSTPVVLGLDQHVISSASQVQPLAASSGAGRTLFASSPVNGSVKFGFVDGAGVATPSSELLGSAHHIVDDGAPASAFDGANHLVVWPAFDGIRGELVTPAGEELDPEGFQIATSGPGVAVAVAFDGVNYLVVWREDTTSASAVRAARVSPAGVALDPAGIDIASYPGCASVDLSSAGITVDSGRFMVAWRACGPEGPDVFGAEIAPDGTVRSTFPITADASDDGVPALSSTGKGVVLAAYSSLRKAAPYGTTRVFVRVIEARCASDADCAPGDACYEAPVCDPSSSCTYAPKPDGAPCGQGGTCKARTCISPGAGGSGGGGGSEAQGASESEGPIIIDGCGCRAASGEPTLGGSAVLAPFLGLLAIGCWARRQIKPDRSARKCSAANRKGGPRAS
ncbi:hypothetical protein [Sorangium sp. So ce1182]|uniref:hypothetical protein n=1 Tax=Sorangium sp. So ce1182 TaxID=3133334 RepID=UPI003F6145F3